MICNFPSIHPGELFYSACARFQDRTRYPSVRATLLELFGSASTCAVDLPCHLKDFQEVLPPGHGYTADRLIQSHTLFPLFRPFLPPDRAVRLSEDMKGEGGLAAHRRSGVMASRIPLPECLRFCPVCREEDIGRFTETYWHRVHQIPGVLVCPTHEVFLQTSAVYTAHSRNHHRLLSAQESIGITPVNAPDPSNPSHNVLLNIARSAAWLLDQTDLYSTPEGLHSRYLSLLIPLGYATYSGCIYAERLAEAFRARYDDGLLKRLHCAFSGSDPKKDGWLLRLVRRPKHAQHPLRHLLVLDFLETPAWSFFSLPEKLEFFGTGPWPCLNKAATHYGELVVTSCRVTHRGRSQRPVGTFECACGFVYSRTGPDGGPEDRYHIGKMKSFGPAWEARLEKLWNDESLCVSEIACRLGVDPLTIRRHAARLGLPSDQRGNRAAVKSSLLLKTRNTTPGKMK